jgi:hypothetical protein
MPTFPLSDGIHIEAQGRIHLLTIVKAAPRALRGGSTNRGISK